MPKALPRKVKACLRALDYTGPIFLYDGSIIDQQVRKLKNAFAKLPKFELLYAIKANSSEVILPLLADLCAGFHVSSADEINLASKHTDYISFTGPIITEKILEAITRHSVTPIANNIPDLKKLSGIPKAGIRINPQIGWSDNPDHFAGSPDSQFGISPLEFKRHGLVTRRDITLLHMHTSSDSHNVAIFVKAFREILALAAQTDSVSTINLGGGLGIPLKTGRGEFPVAEYAYEVATLVANFERKHGRRLTIQLEPGSYLVRESGYYISKIHSQLTKQGKRYYYSDGSDHHLCGQPLRLRKLLTDRRARVGKAIIFGATCQRGDVLFSGSQIPRLTNDDFVIIPDTGAYCAVQADNFNLIGFPAERLI